jgi:hypothetical protein
MAAPYTDPKTGMEIPRLKTPNVGPRKDEGAMTDDVLHSTFEGLVDASKQYVDQEISPLRAAATKYYKAEKFGNETKGRSQYVSTDVRDNVLATLPAVLRVIFGPEKVVEFRPDSKEAVAGAAQATDYVNYVFSEDNKGFLETLAVLKDGFIRKTGFYKWAWDESYAVKTYHLDNVSEEQLLTLTEDEEVEITRVRDAAPGPDGIPLYDVELTRKEKDGKVCIYAVPPEEVIWNREARSFEDSLIVAHDTALTHGEIIAMGVDAKVVKEHGGKLEEVLSEEEIARNPGAGEAADEVDAGEANIKTRFVEGYVRIDYDGDGIAELRKIVGIGPDLHIVENEPVDCIPMSMFCPDPEPHTVLGQSLADRTMDIQLLKSSLLRSTLDSASSALFPRTVYKHGEANIQDILNTALGAPIRTTGDPNASVREFAHTFMGKELFPILSMCDDIIERRTGQNRGAQGLDANALQSSTKTAVAAAVTASQMQQEMLVRIFAEQTLKPMFRGILKLLVQKQPRERMVRLRNQWVNVDPRPWNADMDVQVNVMLGAGLTEEKIETLALILAKMEQIIANMGEDNPICDIKQYRDTLAELAELRGRRDSEKYFKVITVEQMQAMAEARANQPPPKDPKVQIAEMEIAAKSAQAQAQMQIDQQKAQMEIQLEQMKMERQLQLEAVRAEREAALEQMRMEREMTFEQQRIEMEHYRIEMENDRLRDKQAAEIQLKIKELELKGQIDLNEQQITADIERERITSQKEGANPAPTAAPAAPKQDIHVNVHMPKAGKKTVKANDDGSYEVNESE